MPTLQASRDIDLGPGPDIDSSVSPAGLFSRPLPLIPSHPASAQGLPERQGREKRQRRNSSSGDVGNVAISDEGDSLKSFRFPANIDSPKSLRSMRRSMSDASVHQRVMSSDKENDREPFTYATFSAVAALPYIPLPKDSEPDEGEKDMEVEEDVVHANQEESTFADNSTAKNETRLSAEQELDSDGEDDDRDEGTSLFRSRKRPPLPLDFTREQTRKNTVPAGLFKALASASNRDNDDRARNSVRSRLSSRDLYNEYRRPSLDDIDVPRISGTLTRGRFITDPTSQRGRLLDSRQSSEDGDDDKSDDEAFEKDTRAKEDVFSSSRQQQQHRRRGSSLPSDLHDREEHETSRALPNSPSVEMMTREDMQDFEERLVGLIEDKFTVLERDRRDESLRKSVATLSSKTEAMVADMVSLFRVQLQESAARGLEDSQMDARGEMDFQLIKDIIEEGHRELAAMLRKELKEVTEHQPQPQLASDVVVRTVEDVGSRTVSAIAGAIADFSARQEVAVNRVASPPARERDTLVEMVVNALSPAIAATRLDPIDYDSLTDKLAQAVKPHISQLIDLTSDKRETAGLIVDRILPLLPPQTPIDVSALTLELTAEVRRAIAPIDAYEIRGTGGGFGY